MIIVLLAWLLGGRLPWPSNVSHDSALIGKKDHSEPLDLAFLLGFKDSRGELVLIAGISSPGLGPKGRRARKSNGIGML